MRLKDRIESSNFITVKSAQQAISRFIKSLEDDGKELFTEEKAMLEKFKALIHGYPNSTKLNKT